ncbi:hypothetical protein CCHR01_18454 [Colletotrichum chrysophilum]|uniref:Ankyrin repeat protein n=1 Tax=Colletotrichum chrysophilum TaxID=1836956 RepID=A0AAD9E8N0_9PEZI|nr:hypothetical protein CCHR01_18454 [Colletotrichum chrysophilum]
MFQQAYKSCATYLGHRNEDQTPRLIRILDSAFNDENGSITESDIQEVLVFQARQAQRLLDIGADPNARDRICWTPLHHACEVVLPRRSKRSSKRPTWLESYQISTRSNFKAPVDANSEIVLPSSKTTLPQREDSDHAEASDYAEKFDIANSDDLGTDIRWERRQQDNRTENFYVKLALERVEILLQRNADINAQSLDGSTPLHCAASGFMEQPGFKIVFDVWGQHGQVNAIWNSLDNLRRTSFHLAAEHRSDEAIRRIIDGMNRTGFWGSAIANVLAQQDIFGDTALMKAMNSRSLVSAQVLCEYQEDENATEKWDKEFLELKNQDGYTALAIAVSTLFKEGVEYLIGRGANMNTECFERKGLLHYAVSSGSWIIAGIITTKADTRSLHQGPEWQKWAERCPLPVERQWRLQLAKVASRANRAMGTSILPRIPEDDTLN